MGDEAKEISILYRNHRGEISVRRIRPVEIVFHTLEPWHPEPQWLLRAFDCDKGEMRSFAMNEIRAMFR